MKGKGYLHNLLLAILIGAALVSCKSIKEKPKKSIQTLLTNDSLKYWEQYRRSGNYGDTLGCAYDIKKHIAIFYLYYNKRRCTPAYFRGKSRLHKGYLKADRIYWNEKEDSLIDYNENASVNFKIAKISEDTIVFEDSVKGDSKPSFDIYVASRDQVSRIVVVDTSFKILTDYTHIVPFDSIK